MNRMLLSVALFALVLVSNACIGPFGDGKLETRTYDLKNFTMIEAVDSFHVTVTRGESFRVELTTDANLIDRIKLDVVSGALRMEVSGMMMSVTRLDVAITMPDLQAIWAKDAVKMTILGFTIPSLLIDASDACDIDLDKSLLTSAVVNLSDASEAVLRFPDIGAGRLTGRIQDASTLYYYGNPAQVDVSCQDASRCIKR